MSKHVLCIVKLRNNIVLQQEFRTEKLGKLNTAQSNLLNKIEENILQRNAEVHAGWVACDALLISIMMNPKVNFTFLRIIHHLTDIF
jgi:hypothetical protein